MKQNRVMAWVAKIDETKSISGADRIEAYRIGGWWVVDQKSRYKVNDLVIYVSIDAWVPTEIAPFLSKDKEPREYNGIKGERLRTIKLRKTLSQGLILPASIIGKPDSLNEAIEVFTDSLELLFCGADVAERLGIQKWEEPIPAQLAGDVVGRFPSFIEKTDQTRIQSLSKEFEKWKQSSVTFEVTEKLDGSSMTVFLKDGHFGVCSRNYELTEDSKNSFWKVARELKLQEVLETEGEFAIQGELIGEGVQSNPYQITGHTMYVFDVFDITAGKYLNPSQRIEFCARHGLKHTKVLDSKFSLKNQTIDSLLKLAEGKSSLFNVEREGIVFKCNEAADSFKAISNLFLLKLEQRNTVCAQ